MSTDYTDDMFYLFSPEFEVQIISLLNLEPHIIIRVIRVLKKLDFQSIHSRELCIIF